jgi:hypothetical protein
MVVIRTIRETNFVKGEIVKLVDMVSEDDSMKETKVI